MAKPLVFDYGGRQVAVQLEKVDRSKLYGYIELEVLDEEGKPCQLATLASDGRTVAARGGVALAYLSPDGSWRDRAELRPIDVTGREVRPVPSSYAAPVPLVERATVEQYLDHIIRAIYRLEPEAEGAALWEELRRGTIFRFPYSFRGGLEADAGFLLANLDGEVFLAVGNPAELHFVGLQQAAAVVESEEAEDVGDEDQVDFDMI